MEPYSFADKVTSLNADPLQAQGIDTLQVNVGRQCNLRCTHCHVNSLPQGSAVMAEDIIDRVLQVLKENPIGTLDLTGGAPELNPHFRKLVTEARYLGCRVIARTNLTIFFEPGMEGLPEFYRDHDVELIASMPCYLEENVDRMRGDGVYRKTIAALKKLNTLGYGTGRRSLSLVYNPGGPFLPPEQAALEGDYKKVLKERDDILFDRLLALTNMPLGRFREQLERSGNLEKYMRTLARAFNEQTLHGVMCRSLISVGWDGNLYDCDFNQALGLSVTTARSRHISSFDYEALSRRMIALGDHCFGCTAGQGSSCSGAMKDHASLN